jgi:L-fuculose-phosphate aldolase
MTSRDRFSLLHPRQAIVETIERIYRYRMTTTSGGNISVLDEAGDVWVTPARVDKGSLRPTDVVRVRPGGEAEGLHKPSSEFPFHRMIYAERPDVRAVVHAHPVALVAFSICGRSPDPTLFPQAWDVCGAVGFAPYALPGSDKLGQNVAAVFATGVNCVMLENHGVVVGGRTLAEAFARFETLEFTAKTAIKAARLGTVRGLTPAQLELSRKPRAVAGTFEPGEPTSAEREARQAVAEFVRRAYRQRLMTCAEGSFSARLDASAGLGDDAFVITATGVDRAHAEPENLVLVVGGKAEAGKRPSRAALAHRAIYRRHPAVRAITNAMPVNAAAFGVVGPAAGLAEAHTGGPASSGGVAPAALDARTIPESYIFLRDVGRASFGVQYVEPERLADLLSPDRPVLLLENDGAMVVGTSPLDAFDRLEVLESTAEALINARSVGPLSPMGPEVIEELSRAFLGN